MNVATLTGLLLIIVPMAFNITFFLLQRAFEYPNILRQPTETILQRFKQGGAPLLRLWYAVTFVAFHRYAGVAVGEHLGYLFTSTWTVLLCIAVVQTGIVNPLIGWLGIIPAIGVLAGVFEETGFKAAGAANAIGYILWSLWLVAFGIALLLR